MSPSATAIGAGAWAALASGSGTVVAVFDSSAYLRGDNGAYACLLPAHAEPGPLHVLIEGPMDLRALRSATGWSCDQTGLMCGPWCLELGRARRWQPPVFPIPLSAESAQPGPATGAPLSGQPVEPGRAYQQWLALVGPGEVPSSFAAHRIAHGTPALDWGRAARPGIAALRRWLRAPAGKLPADVTGLIGLGPGLTPSGDDVLGGLAITLHHAGLQAHLRALAEALRPALGHTHPLSAAHLDWAMRGAGAEALHLWIGALLAGHPPPACLTARITALGHSSGWDMLAGAGLYFDSLPATGWQLPVCGTEQPRRVNAGCMTG